MSNEMSHETNRLIHTVTDAMGRPLGALAQEAPSWFLSKKELKVEVSDTAKSSLQKDSEIAKQMALDGHSKEEVMEHLDANSRRMQGFETKEQKEQYFQSIIEGAYQVDALAFAKERGIDLSPVKGVELNNEKTL